MPDTTAANDSSMIVEASDNALYAVRETNDPNLAHVWHAIPMKRAKAGAFVVKGSGSMRLLRKAGCRIVRASFGINCERADTAGQ